MPVTMPFSATLSSHPPSGIGNTPLHLVEPLGFQTLCDQAALTGLTHHDMAHGAACIRNFDNLVGTPCPLAHHRAFNRTYATGMFAHQRNTLRPIILLFGPRARRHPPVPGWIAEARTWPKAGATAHARWSPVLPQNHQQHPSPSSRSPARQLNLLQSDEEKGLGGPRVAMLKLKLLLTGEREEHCSPAQRDHNCRTSRV